MGIPCCAAVPAAFMLCYGSILLGRTRSTPGNAGVAALVVSAILRGISVDRFVLGDTVVDAPLHTLRDADVP
jgi:hypothetical protein